MGASVTLVTKPTAAEEVRESVIRLLRKTLDEAEAGQIETVIIIGRAPDGEWINRASETNHFSDAIGRLEITKAEWIAQYLEQRK